MRYSSATFGPFDMQTLSASPFGVPYQLDPEAILLAAAQSVLGQGLGGYPAMHPGPVTRMRVMTVRHAAAPLYGDPFYGDPLYGDPINGVGMPRRPRLPKPQPGARPRSHSVHGAEPVRGRILDLEPIEEPVVQQEPQPKGSGQSPAAEAVRALLRPPGPTRVVRWQNFEAQLRPQLARPERLTPEHRLECRLQVFLVGRPHSLSELARTLLGEGGERAELKLLTPTDAARLGLRRMWAKFGGRRGPRPGGPEPSPAPDVLLPGDLMCRLQVIHDPTARPSMGPKRQRSRPPDKQEPRTAAAAAPVDVEPGPAAEDAPVLDDARDSDVAPVAPAAAVIPAAQPGLREIPRRFLSPWGFQVSREEALYDMNSRLAHGPLSSLRGSLRRRFGRRSRLRRWQALLAGRPLAEQLWAVRPPDYGLTDPVVLEWAHRTLSLDGYDADAMLAEWELFWRQKGVPCT